MSTQLALHTAMSDDNHKSLPPTRSTAQATGALYDLPDGGAQDLRDRQMRQA